MSKGERWKKFVHGQSWVQNNIVTAGEDKEITIFITLGDITSDRKSTSIDSAMIMDDGDILCYEGPNGTAFFQWDDIIQIKVDQVNKKKGWL